MARRYGRSPRGRRLAPPVPHGHWKTSSLVAGLRLGGIIAPLVIDHPMNGITSPAYPILLPEQGSLPFEALEVFQRCVMIAAAEIARRRPLQDAGAGTLGAALGDQGAVR